MTELTPRQKQALCRVYDLLLRLSPSQDGRDEHLQDRASANEATKVAGQDPIITVVESSNE